MRKWWFTATTGDRIAVITLVITILGIIPAYVTIFAMNNTAETSPTTPPNVPTTVSKIESARNVLSTFPGNDFSCEVQQEDDSYQDDLAYTFCAAEPSISYLALSIYDTTIAMNSNFGSYLIGYGNQSKHTLPVDRDTRNCRSGKASKGTWAYRNDPEGNPVGRFVCYVDDSDTASILWTYNKRKILAEASRDDENLEALYEWWEKHWATRP
jgi:hypothetical protein